MSHYTISHNKPQEGSSASSSSTRLAVVLRTDEGSGRDRGDYECQVQGCRWSRCGAGIGTPYEHVRSKHAGYTIELIQPNRSKRVKMSAEQAVLSHRDANRRYSQKRKHSQILIGPDLMVPFAVSDTGSIWPCGASVGVGKGMLQMSLGPLDIQAQESCRVAVSFVSVHAHLLAPLMATTSPAKPRDFLYNKYTDLHITGSSVDVVKKGPSLSARVALALLLLLGQRPTRHDRVGVTGAIDLCGNIGAVGAVEDKIRYSMESGLDLMIVPAENYDNLEFEEAEQDEEEGDEVREGREKADVKVYVDSC